METISNKHHFAILETLNEMEQGHSYFQDKMKKTTVSHEILYQQLKFYLSEIIVQMELSLMKFKLKKLD